MSKFEKWKENGMSESMSGAEKKFHQEFTDPVVSDLINTRKKWDAEFEKRTEEKIVKLTEAEQKRVLVFPKNK